MISIRENRCDYCGACVTVCPVDCIEVREASIMIEHTICIDCDLCVEICPIEVLESNAAE
jgi:ferredoxin